MATGGLRQKRALNTVEVFDPKRPKVSLINFSNTHWNGFHQAGWKKLSKLKMPAAVSEHCAVTLKGVDCHIVNRTYPKPSKMTNVTSSIELTQNPQRSSWQGGDHQWRQGQGEEGDEAGRQDTEMVTSVTRAPHIL